MSTQTALKAYLGMVIHQDNNPSEISEDISVIASGTFGLILSRDTVNWILKIAREVFLTEVAGYRGWLSAEYMKPSKGLTVSASAVVGFHKRDDEQFWTEIKPHLPKDVVVPTTALFMDRIFPMPDLISDFLIGKYCPEVYRAAAKKSEKN